MSYKYSIIMPCYNRPVQLHNTLMSLRDMYSRRDFEIIIHIDPKEYINLPEVYEHTMNILRSFHNLCSFEIKIMLGLKPEVSNPCLAYNSMANSARGKYLILTNPECFHENDILAGLDELFAENEDYYVVCACKDSKIVPTTKASSADTIQFEFKQWLQHTVHTNRCLHFCSALKADNYHAIGGFDEGYALGSGREDVDFLETIKHSKMVIKPVDNLIVCHQQHDHSQDTAEKRQINIDYYKNKWNEFTSNPVVKTDV